MLEQIANKDIKFFFKEIEILNLQNEKLLEYSHSRFNIFTIIREGTEEVGLHSAFIGELLNPKGLHQMGSTFLELFLNEVLPENEKLKIENTSVETEKWIGEIDKGYDSDTGGAIDIFITNDNYKIAIENKIYAGDQHKQLNRYHNFIKDKSKKSFLFYLTLDGHLPSDNSIGKLKESDFFNISYREDILKWLNLCKEKVCDIPRIKEPIQQYIDLVKELTGQSLNDEYIMSIKDFITKNPKNFKLAKDITEAFEKSKVKIQSLFLKELSDLLKNNYKITDDYTRSNYQGINIHLRNNEEFCFRVEIDGRVYFGFQMLDVDNARKEGIENSYRKDISQKLSKIYNNYSFKQSNNWLGWTWVNTEIIKDFNFKTFNTDEIFDLADNEKRKELTKELAHEIKNIIDEFN